MKKNKILLLLITLTTCFSCNVKSVDSIIINAKIYTVNNQNEIAKSIVIKDGKILDISNSNLNKKYYSNTIIDAKGKTILPGLIDSHCHFYNLGLSQQVINLRGTKSLNEILEKLIEYDNENSPRIILGRGWDQNDWENKNFPNNLKLNQLFPNKIVVLERVDGHAYLTNNYTLNLARINENTKISGGSIIKEKGKLSGVLIDKPMQLIDKILPKKSISEKIVYGAFEILSKKTDKSPIEFFHDALNNVKPSLEVRSRRVGGATYQVPVEVKSKRSQALALRWLIDASRKRKDKKMSDKIFNEIFDAYQNRGSAIKKKEDTHKMAESNKAFAHFRW